MPVLHLTDATVRDLRTSQRTDYFDDVISGLCLRVSPNGHKAWAVVYRHAGRVRRLTLDAYPALDLAAARKAARAVLTERAGTGRDPAQARRAARQQQTFNELADLYLERYAKARKKSWRVDARQLRVFCRPLWGTRAAADIERRDVRELLAQVAARRSPTIANRLRACVLKLFNWSVSQGLLEQSPALGLPALGKEESRERVLSDGELRLFWAELAAAEDRWRVAQERRVPDPASLSPTLRLWLTLRLLTAQRGGEVSGMRWTDVDLVQGLWTISGASAKSGRVHVVPLAPWPLQLLKDRRAERPFDDYVCEGGRGYAARMGVGRAFSLPDFVAHDLRRTAATTMARLGVTRFVIARVLGHADPTVTGIYDRHEYLDEKRTALERWAVHVARVIGAEQWADGAGKILPFPARAAR